jgi:hypothetical protein
VAGIVAAESVGSEESNETGAVILLMRTPAFSDMSDPAVVGNLGISLSSVSGGGGFSCSCLRSPSSCC